MPPWGWVQPVTARERSRSRISQLLELVHCPVTEVKRSYAGPAVE